LNGFTARDIAEPLASFDDSTPIGAIRAAMQALQLNVAGLRRSGIIAGWLMQDDTGAEKLKARPFDLTTVIADTTSLNDVVRALNTASCLFVRTFGQINGWISRSDLEKPAMRMWLFGLVTITELRVTRLINEVCPQESWRQYLSDGRVQKASELQQERQRRGQSPNLLECLQFADKGQIVARHEAMRARTRFSSRRAVEEFVKNLQSLRNNLAHAQDISGDWSVICELATNLHRIVLGPPDA
jgi:hypothetical protein